MNKSPADHPTNRQPAPYTAIRRADAEVACAMRSIPATWVELTAIGTGSDTFEGYLERVLIRARAAYFDKIERRRLAFQSRLTANINPATGRVRLVHRFRDCDMVEGSRLVDIEPTLEAYEALFDDLSEWAEGPFSLTIVSPEDACEFRPEFRDLALEAFEDGHPHVVFG